MTIHRYWDLIVGVPVPEVYPYPVELSEVRLYNSNNQLGPTIVPTCNIAPTSGSLSVLRDGLLTSGVYWADTTTLTKNSIVLSWDFGTKVEVDGIVLGSQTTIARFPTHGCLVGHDDLDSRFTTRCFGGLKFVSASLTPLTRLTNPTVNPLIVYSRNVSSDGGRGVITDTVKVKSMPTNIPIYCKVRLVRERDGKVIRETYSNPLTGVYSFSGFSPDFTYSIIAIHPTGGFRAVIADRIVPGIMP